MIPAAFLTIGMAVMVAAILVLVALSGRIRPRVRLVIVRVAIVLFYPIFAVSVFISAWRELVAGDWVWGVLNVGVAIILSVNGVLAWRGRSLFPRAHPASA